MRRSRRTTERLITWRKAMRRPLLGHSTAGMLCRPSARCEKTPLSAVFVYQKRSFYQDRLGTNIGKAETREAFCAGRFRVALFGGADAGQVQGAGISALRVAQQRLRSGRATTRSAASAACAPRSRFQGRCGWGQVLRRKSAVRARCTGRGE